jgi:hypothetical protein
LAIYRRWVRELWEMNSMEGNSLFTYMTLAMLPEHYVPPRPGEPRELSADVPHASRALADANETLARFPIDRVLRPVMNSLRTDVELNPHADRGGARQAARPLSIDERPHDNEYEWKGNPYRLDGWLKPALLAMEFACDDPQVAWFCDATGRLYRTLDGGASWQDVSRGLRGASVQNIVASQSRTFVLWAQTSDGLLISRDGGLSWRNQAADPPEFPSRDAKQWTRLSDQVWLRVNDQQQLESTTDGAKTVSTAMDGWRIPRANFVQRTPRGVVASGPGGAYRTADGKTWEPLSLWREQETGAADYLHAYWMGRYYGFVPPDPGGRQ